MRFNLTDGVCLCIIAASTIIWLGMKINTDIQDSKPVGNEEEDTVTEEKHIDTLNCSGVADTSGFIDGYAYVDLGLPSGLKWAVCDVGTTIPGHDGKLFCWSITTPYIPGDTFPEANYEIPDLYTGHDAATKNMSELWRTPTLEEFEELTRSCNWKNYDIFHVIGTSRYNKKKIVLVSNWFPEEEYSDGRYWTATVFDTEAFYTEAYCLVEICHTSNGNSCEMKFEENDKSSPYKIRAVSDYKGD